MTRAYRLLALAIALLVAGAAVYLYTELTTVRNQMTFPGPHAHFWLGAAAVLGLSAILLRVLWRPAVVRAARLQGNPAPEDVWGLDRAILIQFVHSVMLAVIGVLAKNDEMRHHVRAPAWSFLFGVFLFCGSKYIKLSGDEELNKLARLERLGAFLIVMGWLSWLLVMILHK